MGDRGGGGGCWKTVGCGCIVVLALIALGVVGLVTKWGRLAPGDVVQKVRRTVAQGKEAVTELHALEMELGDGLDAAAVHLGATFDNRGRRVQVTVVDPVLPADLDPAVWAREVAVRIGERMLPIVALDEIQVTIEEQGGPEGATRSARQYNFPIDSLPELQEIGPAVTAVPTTPPVEAAP